MELMMLTGDKNRKLQGDANHPENVHYFMDGQFEEVLQMDASRNVIGVNLNNIQHLDEIIVKNTEMYLSDASNEEDKSRREMDVLITAATCLQLFVQNNWLGPVTHTPPSAFLPQPWTEETVVKEMALTCLSEDGEPVCTLASHAGFLYLARTILLDCRHLCSSLQTWDWWLVRCLSVQQTLLEQRSPTLRATMLERLDDLSKRESLLASDSNRDVAVLFHVEAVRICQMFWEDKRMRDHVMQGRKLSGLKIELSGALGKRTRFQQDDKAQLVVTISHEEGELTLPRMGLSDPDYPVCIPENLSLNDDTVLNKIHFKDGDVCMQTKLSPLEQALLLAHMESYRRDVAQERLTDEEVMAYLDCLLAQVSCWAVSVAALAIRSKIESNSRRRVERSMQQLEELVNQVSHKDPSSVSRLVLFYAARPPTIWAMQSDLAGLLLSMGCIGAALDVYERLQLWENVISCYQQMGKREKAEALIREQLAIKETPSLLCFLGDVTRNTIHYQRAWELSNQRSGRAMRCMGYVHFSEERYEAAIECFEKSLAINSLQIPVWFTCGCACMAAEKYESAVKAFRRCVNIDYDNFEAWSNLATAYARLKQKHKAFLTVKDAIRCNYDNWRLWENCLVFATDCGEFEDVIQAYHRLMDLRDGWSDAQVLRIIVRAVVENMEDAGGQPAARLHTKLLELFGRITAKVTSDAGIWQLYSDLTRAETEYHKPDLEKALQFLQKSHRCFLQVLGWEKDVSKCKQVAEQSLKLAQAYTTCADKTTDQQHVLQLLSSSKLMMKGTITKIKQQYTSSGCCELPESLVAIYNSLAAELENVSTRVDRLRAS